MLKNLIIINSGQLRRLSTTVTCCFDQKWRIAKGLPMNPNAYGILTDGQDYSYLDGRATPYAVGQKRRIIVQKELAENIIKFSKEVDFAVERHKNMQEEEENRKQNILDKKLKPKGIELLRKAKKR